MCRKLLFPKIDDPLFQAGLEPTAALRAHANRYAYFACMHFYSNNITGIFTNSAPKHTLKLLVQNVTRDDYYTPINDSQPY